jgi:hypothetical protein
MERAPRHRQTTVEARVVERSRCHLLSFAEDQGLEPAFSCRAGVCGTCACRVIEGEVTYISEPWVPVARGSALICIAKPKGANLSLEL